VSELIPFQEQYGKMHKALNSPAMLQQLAAALPAGSMTPERMVRLALTEIQRVRKLAICTRESFLGGLLTATAMGLEIGVAGQGWLVPFYNAKQRAHEATLIVGYRGMAKLAYRGKVKDIEARVVYEGDDFSFLFGDEGYIRHRPVFMSADPLKATHAWVLIRTGQGGAVRDVMSREEIEKVRKRSRAGNDGPWITDWPEMAKKTVFRRAAKYAPSSIELERAIELDDQVDRGVPQDLDKVDAALLDMLPEAPEAKEGEAEASSLG